MVFALTWLPEVLEAAGLKVAETSGWRTHGRGSMDNVRGVMCHHTATAAPGNMPTLGLLIHGRPDLQGPLAQLGLGRDGTFYVIAAGRANHAGAGRWEGLVTGNSSFIGIEAEHSGRPQDAWPAVQIDAYQRGVAALLKKLGREANMCCGHKEYALPAGRKVDPAFDMPAFRNQVAAFLAGKTPPPPIPAQDDEKRPTIRRGSIGPFVDLAQRALGIAHDGKFGPGTEAAMRAFQRTAGLTPDGIVGPQTWVKLIAAAPAGTATTNAPQPAAAHAPVPAAPPADAHAPPAAVRPAAAAAPPLALPLAEDPTHPARVEGKIAFGPDGRRFASRQQVGFFTTGVTTARGWLDGGGTAAGLSPSLVRVVAASCANEGGLEAINSYDNCHVSFGVCQWTAAAGGDPGELAILLRRFKAADPAGYDDCFGRYGLFAADAAGDAVGLLVLDGKRLATGAQKDALRDVRWAYRFWRAGHHPSLRAGQIALAAARTRRFLDASVAGRPLREWVTSELGIALILDEHINRPGHVPDTLARAVAALPADAHDPHGWTAAQERTLRGLYLKLRKTTSMTDSDARAATITALVAAGKVSDARGSFVT